MSLALTFVQPPVLPEILSELTAKSFKTSTSHDGATLTAFDLFIGKTKIGRVYEDDWSGDIMLNEVNSDALKAFDDYRTRPDIDKFISEQNSGMSDRNWALIAIHVIFRDINGHKSVTRKSVKNLMVGTRNRYICVSWPKRNLADIPSGSLQKEIAELIDAAAKKGVKTTLLNTPEQLKSLGIQFTEVKQS